LTPGIQRIYLQLGFESYGLRTLNRYFTASDMYVHLGEGEESMGGIKKSAGIRPALFLCYLHRTSILESA